MTVKVEVVYPSTSSFSGTAQLDIGPFPAGTVNTLLRAEVNGAMNWQSQVVGNPVVVVNTPLWALQWVPHTAAPSDCVTTADGPNWLIRQQIGRTDVQSTWAPSTSDAVLLGSSTLVGSWAGQLVIGSPTDLWLSLKSPSGIGMANFNLFASIRWWWT